MYAFILRTNSGFTFTSFYAKNRNDQFVSIQIINIFWRKFLSQTARRMRRKSSRFILRKDPPKLSRVIRIAGCRFESFVASGSASRSSWDDAALGAFHPQKKRLSIRGFIQIKLGRIRRARIDGGKTAGCGFEPNAFVIFVRDEKVLTIQILKSE